MPAVSIILPSRMRHGLLSRALKCLFGQTFCDFEIILVDDNPIVSRIASVEHLEELVADPRVRLVVHDSPMNAASARNFGLQYARGKYITYLDDDDVYHPCKLQKQWEIAEGMKSPLVLCGLLYHLLGRTKHKQVSKDMFSGKELFLDVFAGTPVLFHLNDSSLKFNEVLFANEDAYFYFSLLEKFDLHNVPNVPEALVEIYPHSGERVSANSYSVWKGDRKIYFDFAKKFPLRDSRLYLARISISRYKYRTGCWFCFSKNCIRLLKIGGIREVRFVLNAFVAKIPILRRFVIT